jgi:serine protease Do
MRVSEQLRATGRVQRGRLGVQIDQVSKEVAESLGLSKPQGALVRGVEQGSPAEKAGLEAGDIILRFDGKLIEKSADLPRQVGNTKPGTVSKLQIWRHFASCQIFGTHAKRFDRCAKERAQTAWRCSRRCCG